jgi:hypothetical protein
MHALQRRVGFLLFLLLLALVCYPVLVTQYLPLADYPNHLARIYVLAEGSASAFLRLYYTPMIQAQPNLAMDLFVLAVHPPLSIEAAGKACIVFAFLLIASGAHVLHRVVAGRWSPWPSVVLLFLYNRLFYWGFIGFMVGLGTMLYGVALWIGLRERPWQRLAASCVFAVILYIVHLFAFCAYAVAIGGYELYGLIVARAGWRVWLRTAAMGSAQFIAPVALFVFVSPTAEAVDRITWGIFFKKIAGVVYTTSSYNLVFDMLSLVVFGVIVLAALVWRAASLPRALIISFAVLFALGVAMPEQIFSSYFASERMPLILAFLAVPCLVWAPERRAVELAATFAVGLLIAVKMILVAHHWRAADRLYVEAVAAIKTIPHNARVSSVIAYGGGSMLPDTPFHEIASLSVLYSEAFVPSLFAWPYNAAQSVGFTEKGQALVRITPIHKVWLPTPDSREYANMFREDMLRNYDYIFVHNEQLLTHRVPEWLETVARGTNFRLLRVPKK